MTMLARTLTLCGAIAAALLSLGSAEAQPFARTWVASTGSNALPCTRSAPCASFDTALANTEVGGFIHCVDAGSFGTVLINKSVTIDCHDVFGAIGSCVTTPITINIPPGSPGDPRRTVRLRNLNLDGSVLTGGSFPGSLCFPTGIDIQSAAAVSIENVVVQQFASRGISDRRTTGGRLTIVNSTLRNSAGFGLVVLPSSGSTRIDVALDNVTVTGNGNGMAFGNGARAMVSRSVIANNTGNGIESDNISGGTGTQVAVDSSTVSNNGTALFSFGGAGLNVSNSNIAQNAQIANGAWITFGNNRVQMNLALGTAPTAAGAATHDLGQF
jgi:hypothetical protein